MAATAELVLDAKAELGEGPLWDSKTRVLYWVDILKGELHRYDPRSGKDQTFKVGGNIGTVVSRAKGGLVLALRSGLAGYDPATGKLDMLAEPEKENPGVRFNDGKCDPRGRFWAGTMAYDMAQGAGKLYRMDAKGKVQVMIPAATISNGLVWSSDRKTFYYIDSPTSQIAAYDYDDETGEIRNRRIAVEVPKADGIPDGMAIDVEDKLWVAHWGGSQVVRWDAKTGKALARIRVPASQTTACAFGGPDMDRLYITSARTGLKEEQLKGQEPHAGGLFCADPGVHGQAFPPYAG